MLRRSITESMLRRNKICAAFSVPLQAVRHSAHRDADRLRDRADRTS